MADKFTWPNDAEVDDSGDLGAPHVIETVTFQDGTVVEICAERGGDYDPRESYDHAGTMIYFGRDYLFGDEQDASNSDDPDAIDRYASDAAVLIPLRFEDRHYDATVYATDAEDANGCIYVDERTVVKEWGNGYDDKTPIECARDHLESEIAEYASYLQGEVYWWSVEHPNPGVRDESCGGYIGDLDYVRSEALDAARYAQQQHQNELNERESWAARGVLTTA